MHNHFVLITGCSGGGKSSLLLELERRGHRVVEEPGRRIVQHQMQTGGHALPWDDMLAFLDLAIATALADRTRMQAHTDWVFFDRGLVDAASAMEHLTNHPKLVKMNALHPYHRRVFLAPPWREIYDMDDERRHGMQAAIDEYERLKSQLPRLGYEVIELPKSTISSRADFVLETLARH